jgi:spore germination cell wall hydrolase CwlJ-like protein
MLRLKSSPGAGRSESDALKAGALKAGALSEAERSARGKLRATQCLATAMYFEARGEPSRGQFIVGRVILNRVASRFYPNDICAVVYQNANLKNRCQFSFACDGAPNLVRDIEAWREIRRRATYLVECDD